MCVLHAAAVNTERAAGPLWPLGKLPSLHRKLNDWTEYWPFSDVAPCRCRLCHTLQYFNTVSTFKVFASPPASWAVGGQNVAADHFQFSFYFLFLFSNECDNQLYLVTVHLVLLCQSRIFVLFVSFWFLMFVKWSFTSCLSVFKSAYLLYILAHTDSCTLFFFSQPPSGSQLHCSCTCRCPRSVFLFEHCGIEYQLLPLGFDWIIFSGIRFLLDWRSKVTASSSALALHYHEASECRVPHHLDHSEEWSCRKVWSSPAHACRLTPLFISWFGTSSF